MQDLITTVVIPIGVAILGATITIIGFILTQSRAIRSELREAARERAELRDRMGRIEGTLDVLREFLLRTIRSQTEPMRGPSSEGATSQEEDRTHGPSYRKLM